MKPLAINLALYHSILPLIEEDFEDAVVEFFSYGKLLKQWNHTIIMLVLKSTHAIKVEDYRHISCCTVFYKMISKIVTSRLAKVVGGIFHPA